MVRIQGGVYTMGSDEGPVDEKPMHRVIVPPFDIDRTEVTVAAYQRCVSAGVCSATTGYAPLDILAYCNAGHPERQNHPINCVSWDQARIYCSWTGKRLPTEEEWEYAARNRGRKIRYPWGDGAATCALAVMNHGGFGCGQPGTREVCSRPAGNTMDGLCDMAGNVWEWTSTRFCPYADKRCADPSRAIRGGSWNNTGFNLRSTNRCPWDPRQRIISIGVRCAR
jgi:formylglycine-generating enzyme required for sulfatase activity